MAGTRPVGVTDIEPLKPVRFRVLTSGIRSATMLFALSCLGLLSVPASPEAGFRKVPLATGLFEPIQLDVARDGSVVFAERKGAVKQWHPETGLIQVLANLPVFSRSEDGLLGLALDPGFTTNHWLYLFHSTPGIPENRVSRFTVQHGVLDTNSQRVLLHIPTLPKKPNHSGGGLGFDAAGNLYASTGDYTFINDSGGFSPLDDRPGREGLDRFDPRCVHHPSHGRPA